MQLGFVGATDDHNGAAGNVEEAAYVGHVGRIDDTAALRLKGDVEFGPGAITGLWAEQNTRESIYAAVRRRETFATSGPRIQVRFFATTEGDACADADFPKAIVDAGAAYPMGSVVGPAALPNGKARFAVAVWPDTVAQALTDGTQAVATLATVQLIKAHVAKGGGAVVEDPPLAVPGVPPTGGCAVFEDAGFDPNEYAVWYIRVLQVPTWRWSHDDCVELKASDPDWATNYPAAPRPAISTSRSRSEPGRARFGSSPERTAVFVSVLFAHALLLDLLQLGQREGNGGLGRARRARSPMRRRGRAATRRGLVLGLARGAAGIRDR